jgi:hypothetical protein
MAKLNILSTSSKPAICRLFYYPLTEVTMNRIKKAPGANRGGGQDGAGGSNKEQPYCTTRNKPLSNLLDFALNRAEHHEYEAYLHRLAADQHEATARQHRAILNELQRLIPRQFAEKVGRAA